MSHVAKDPVSLARAAFEASKKAMPDGPHPKGPNRYTQPQLAAIHALEHFLNVDYHGVVQYLQRSAELRNALGITSPPHYSTLCYAERCLLKSETPGSRWR